MQNLEAILTEEEYEHFNRYIEPDWVYELVIIFFKFFGFGVGAMCLLIAVSYI